MPEHKVFKGFFSYSHHDAETDPALIPAFTQALENRINAKLTNARFSIWRDRERLRVGDRWSTRIEDELRRTDVLIVLLTPRWVESDYCRKEYTIFEEVEVGREVGEYVAPILARTIERQKGYFTAEQQAIYERIASRQHQVAIAAEFLKLSDGDRTALIDQIADDIEGMIDRLRVIPNVVRSSERPLVRARRTREFDVRAQNYENVDFVTDGEVVLDRPTNHGQRDVLAHVGFIERLYVQGKRGRIEFGVRRAFISLRNEGPGEVRKVDELRTGGDGRNLYYATLHETPDATTVCVDPPQGKSSLAELPLPPAPNENYLAKVASASAEVMAEQLKADLLVSLNVEGLYLADGSDMSPRTENAIKAIIDVAKSRVAQRSDQIVDPSGRFCRKLPVRKRP
jgi:hypothetical protein